MLPKISENTAMNLNASFRKHAHCPIVCKWTSWTNRRWEVKRWSGSFALFQHHRKSVCWSEKS